MMTNTNTAAANAAHEVKVVAIALHRDGRSVFGNKVSVAEVADKLGLRRDVFARLVMKWARAGFISADGNETGASYIIAD